MDNEQLDARASELAGHVRAAAGLPGVPRFDVQVLPFDVAQLTECLSECGDAALGVVAGRQSDTAHTRSLLRPLHRTDERDRTGAGGDAREKVAPTNGRTFGRL